MFPTLAHAVDAAAKCYVPAAGSSPFPTWLRVEHLLNFILMGLLFRSGWEIIGSHPRFYWKNDCGPGTEWIKFTKDKVPTEIGAFTARDDQRSWSPWLVLPGKGQIALGRAWHALVTNFWVLNGLVFYILLFISGQWRTLLTNQCPADGSLIAQAWHSFTSYATFHIPAVTEFHPFDPLQQLMYAFIIFIAAPLMIATGPTMSPTVVAHWPRYAKIFGGRQAARSIHFICMAFLLLFTVMHIALVFIVHPEHNLPSMILGVDDTTRFHQALLLALVTIVLVIAFWIACSFFTWAHLMLTQKILWSATVVWHKLVLNHLPSKAVAKAAFTDKDISPFHWVNTRKPSMEESEEWNALAADGFTDYRLELSTLDKTQTVTYSIDELKKKFENVEQIQMHTCMQGWTGIAKWQGVRLRDVVATIPHDPAAKNLYVESFGLAQRMWDPAEPLKPYYTCLSLDLIDEDETILAWGMNDEDGMHPMYGAPLRLRIAAIHGYKMVKWVRRIEWVRDYREIQHGLGGTREDSSLQHYYARI